MTRLLVDITKKEADILLRIATARKVAPDELSERFEGFATSADGTARILAPIGITEAQVREEIPIIITQYGTLLGMPFGDLLMEISADVGRAVDIAADTAEGSIEDVENIAEVTGNILSNKPLFVVLAILLYLWVTKE